MIDLTMTLMAEMLNLSCKSIAIMFDKIADAFSNNPFPSEAEVTLSGGLRGGLTVTTESHSRFLWLNGCNTTIKRRCDAGVEDEVEGELVWYSPSFSRSIGKESYPTIKDNTGSTLTIGRTDGR